ncbi:MAG TPA: hypothetical protein DDY78_24940, partial [Planctomycetales bacterium]|nr:hypothetical protein [Planctomycetales bacterium]
MTLMPWPLSQDYNEAIQSPATNFTDADLQKGETVANALGIPMPCSGNFADVYQVRCPDGSRWAVKCFTREAPGLRERYQEISSWLRKAKLPFTVDFSYLEQGIRIAGKWHPILKMQWVEGLTLNQFVAQYLDKPAMLEALLQLWAKMGKYLRAAQVGHCDLQHGNVLLVPGSTPNALALKLIDYDGMWIPSLAKTKSGEVGHANFQHPRRLREGTYSLEVDRFPLLLVATAMRALKADKSLWAKYDNGDNLLFKESDLVAPGQSALFEELASLPDPGLVMLAAQVRAALKGSLESAALLEDVMPEAKAPTSSARPSRLVAGPPSGAGFTKTAPMAAPVVAPPPKTEKTFAFDEAGPHSTRIKRKPATKKAAGMPVGLLVAAAVGVIVVIGGAAGAFFLTRGSPKDKPPAKPPAELAVVQSRQIDDSDKEAVKPVGDHGLKPDKSNSEKPVDDGPGPEPAVKPNEEVDADPKGPIGEVRQFEGHTGEIRGLAVSPDGKQLLTASFDKTVRLWDVATGRELQRCEGHTEKVHGVVFLPDGVRALSASDDKTVRLWNLKDGHEIRSFSGHAQPAYMVAVTRDGQIAASCGREDAVFLWNVETGKEVRRLEGNEKGGTESLAFSPDGKLLATGAMQGLIRLWNVETGTEVRRFTGHAGLVYRLAFSSDGRLALSCGLDKTARLWNVEDGREVRRFDQNMGVLYGAAISSNGQRVLTGGVDAEVRLWDAATAKELYRFQRQPGQIRTVAFSPDGRYGFSAGTDKLARMWRLSPADKTAVVKAADQPSAALPFDSGWDKQVDPDGDCKFLAGKNTLTIELPGKDHDLGAERGVMNSPRLLRDVEGDFTVQVRVSGDFRPVGPSTAAGHIPFVGAGLVLMIDDRTYLRVERAAAVFASAGKASPYANMEWRIDGKLRPINGATPPIPEDGPAYLRLQRRSSQLLASNSQDGVKWNALPSMGVPLPPIVKVGLTAGTSSAAPFRPLYDAFKLTADKAGVAVRPAAAEKDLRKPPTSDDLVKARDAVKQEYKADYDKLNTPKDKSDLADKLRTEAFAAKDKPDRQYALLIEARDLAARGEDLAASQRIIDETAMTFAIDPKEAKEAALLTAGATFSTKAAAKAYLAEAAP